MKKILLPALAAMLALALLSCTREDPEEMFDEIVDVTLRATLSGEETKAKLSGSKVLWEAGDKIAVFDGGAIREFTLVSGEGTKSAVFYGRAASSATTFYAVSPFASGYLKDKVLYSSVPGLQTAGSSGVDNSALVMTATAARGAALGFKNAVTLLRFTVPAGVTKVTVSSLDGSAIAGESSSTVSVILPGTAGTYNVAVNPGTYKGVRVFIHTASDVYMKESANTLTATRNAVCNLGTLALTQAIVPIETAANLTAFLKATSASDTRKAIVFNDIDMSGVTISPASDFGGELDGLGHTISGLSGGNSLFTACHAKVSNLTLAGSMTPTQAVFGALAAKNYGALSNVTSKVNVTETLTAATTSTIMIGSLAGYNYGAMTNCVNEGTVKFTSSSSVKAVGIGGLAGYSSGATSKCVNKGAVTFTATHGTGRATVGSLTNMAANAGGIAAVTDNGFSATQCDNYGKITLKLSAIENLPATYNRCNCGGIVGASYGDLTSCHNYGAIVATIVTSSREALTGQECIVCEGGISGSAWGQPDLGDKTNIKNCINDGTVTLKSDAAKTNSTVGGIVGWPNQEKDSTTNKITGCTNNGEVHVEGSVMVRAGGIMGGTGNIASCTNNGRIYVKSANASSLAGGVCGFHSRNHTMTSCTNKGEVTSHAAINGVGGLLGGHGNVALTSCESCTVNCDVCTAASDNSGVGMVVGYYLGTSNKVVLGTSSKPISVSGSIAINNKGYTIHKSNYTSYLAGTANASSDNHVINASCTTSAPAAYTVYGYIRYSDGTPAAGVTVSDGFSVAVTDSKGYYSLKACSDTWYIYYSYPADAKISKNSNGLPAFYKTYDKSVNRYDFTPAKQAVESEFMLFAMADPEVHNAKRESQTTADIDRFKNETVPAINTHIAAQTLPCYGVTLGDIVYSEGSRNSTGGMSTMRSHFALMDMPVFQLIGNHDYTYFYGSSNKLTTDETSSTLYLKAQRTFEKAFGPINYSFNRGSVHFVCMRNIIFDSATDAASYHEGFTDQQLAWLKADLANVPTSKMVVLCVHIPIFINPDGDNVMAVLEELQKFSVATVFSGHLHYHRYYNNLRSTGIADHCHSTVCGAWWWSNLSGDGAPNGYKVYHFNGANITDEYFMGVNKSMNSSSYQMRVYKGNIKTGGSYAYFKFPFDANTLLINVFNGDSRWAVKVYENGVYSGTASFMSNHKESWESVTSGKTYTPTTSSNQDWWAIGYHIGVVGRGRSTTSYYTNQFHMWKYTLKDANASIKVEVSNPYGKTFTTTEVISSDCYYPSYIKAGAN